MSLIYTLQSLRAADAKTGAKVEAMIDLAFELRGDCLPAAYAAALDAALLAELPWLADEPTVAVHRVRAPLTDQGLVLSRRTRLTLRLPATRESDARFLSGRRLCIGDCVLLVGAATTRCVSPFATLKSALVVSSEQGEVIDELSFMAAMEGALSAMAIDAELICGKAASIDSGERKLHGYGLAVHGLTPAASLLLQARGLGPARRIGCGLFVAHKLIDGLDLYPQ